MSDPATLQVKYWRSWMKRVLMYIHFNYCYYNKNRKFQIRNIWRKSYYASVGMSVFYADDHCLKYWHRRLYTRTYTHPHTLTRLHMHMYAHTFVQAAMQMQQQMGGAGGMNMGGLGTQFPPSTTPNWMGGNSAPPAAGGLDFSRLFGNGLLSNWFFFFYHFN